MLLGTFSRPRQSQLSSTERVSRDTLPLSEGKVLTALLNAWGAAPVLAQGGQGSKFTFA